MALNVEEIPLKIEFGGGLELLFSNQRSHRINLPGFIPNETSGDTKTSDRVPDEETSRKPADVNYLLRYLRDNLLKERVELFMENDTMQVIVVLPKGFTTKTSNAIADQVFLSL